MIIQKPCGCMFTVFPLDIFGFTEKPFMILKDCREHFTKKNIEKLKENGWL